MTEDAAEPTSFETDFAIGPGAIDAYCRLSYTMWYALAEFIDNSTQSRSNYENIIDEVLKAEGRPLTVEINHHKLRKELTISDNSIGMSRETLIEALRIAYPTKDSKGRSKYGMGMKTAACWIGRTWKVITCEWGSGKEWTAEVDVDSVAKGGTIPVTMREVSTDDHYTKIIVTNMRRRIIGSTEETIRSYLGSMYRFDLQDGLLQILLNDDPIKPPDEQRFDTDPDDKPMRQTLPPMEINGRKVVGWFGVLARGAGGRKHGGFSLFRHRRQIQGFPTAWKPRSIFSGVDDEGANNLIAQRLTGLLELDAFEVSHTKDAILFEDDEEHKLEAWLYEQTKAYADYAGKRRGPKAKKWSKEKVKGIVEGLKKELESDELKDKLNTEVLPPLEAILKKNQESAAKVTEDETVSVIEILPDLKIAVSFQQRSEHDPYVRITAGAEAGVIYVMINGDHPYFDEMESDDIREECVRQFIYDALAEYRVSKLKAQLNANSTRRMKDSLLRVQQEQVQNAAAAAREQEIQAIRDDVAE